MTDLEQLRQAAERDPALLVRLADSLVAAGKADEAVAVCRRWLARRADDVPLRLALGRALSAMGNLEEAQAAMMDAMARQKRQASKPAPAPAPTEPAKPAAAPITSAAAVMRPPRPVASPAQPVTIIPDLTPTGAPVPNVVPAVINPMPGATSAPPVQAPEFDGEEPTRRAVRRPTSAPTSSRSNEHGTPTDEVDASDIAASFPIDTPPPPIGRPLPSPAHSHPPVGPDTDPEGPIDLERVARQLMTSNQRALKTGEIPQSAEQILIGRGFDHRRRVAFRWLWGTLLVASIGGAGGYFYRAQQKLKLLQLTLDRAAERTRDATYDGDRAARDAYTSIIRSGQKSALFYALAARAEARLLTDHGEDSDAAAWSYLRRAEKRMAPNAPDPSTVEAMRQARALLALSRGETCTEIKDSDGDLQARCAVQRGELAAARKTLGALAAGPDAQRALLALAALEMGAGDTEAAKGAIAKVLAKAPNHLGAQLLQGLVAAERGEKTKLPDSVTSLVAMIESRQPMPPETPQLGPLGTSYYYLLMAQQLLNDKSATDEQINAALDKARNGLRAEPRGLLLYARARLRQGKLVEAERAMRMAERISPNDPEVAVLDAEVALAKGFEEKVAEALKQSTDLQPRAQSVLGRALVLLGKPKEAIAALDGSLARRPGDPTTMAYRALARAKSGELVAADRELSKITEPTGSLLYAQGVIAYERKDWKRAEASLLRARDRSTEALRARALLGSLYHAQGKYKEALTELETVVAMAPSLQGAVSELGRIYLELGRLSEVRKTLRPTIESGKASTDDALNFAEASIALGFLEDGEAQLNAQKGPPSPRLERLRALAQSWKGQKDALLATKTIERLRKGPGASDAKLALSAGEIYRRAGNPKAAETAFGGAVAAEPLRAHLGLGKLALLSGDVAGAETHYRAALDAWEKRPFGNDVRTEARVGLGRALLGKHSLAEASKLLEQALAEDAEASEAAYYLAKVLVEQGDPKAALAKAERACSLDEQFADAFLLVGELAQKGDKSDKDKAKRAYEKFLQLQPNAPQVKTVKKALAALK